MIIFVCILFVLMLINCKPILGKEFYQDYASVDQSRSINGIFIILILLSHTFAKVSVNDVLDAAYVPMRTFLGQFVVVPFLFYSGYGIMESLRIKDSYLKTFPKNRLLKLFLQFSVITFLYIVLHLCLGSDYSFAHILLSFIGVTSIGNGGWYMLSTFFFYISVILCFNLFKERKNLAAISVTLCLLALMAAEMALDFPSYYYSTSIFLAVGMIFALLKESFDSVFMKNNIIWCGFGMLMLLFITMKIRIQNNILIWLGKTTFFIFTLQGIPQIILSRFLSNNYLVYTLTIVITLGFAFLANDLFAKIERHYKKSNSGSI